MKREWIRHNSLKTVYVCDDGKIRVDGKLLKHTVHPRGYRYVYAEKKMRKVHHLVLEAFGFKRPSQKHECMHLDNDPSNNSLANLRWGTHRENMAMDHGNNHAHRRGSNPNAKVTEKDVMEIRSAYSRREKKYAKWGLFEFSKRLGISVKQVQLIAKQGYGGWQ